MAEVEETGRRDGVIGAPHPSIPLPADLYRGRRNSAGLDLTDEPVLRALELICRMFILFSPW